MYNRAILIGRITRDVELKYTPSGTAVTNFTLAINRKFNKEETDFIECQVWRGLAENCANYLHKGSLCCVEGRIQTRTYETQEGQKRKVTEIVADDVRFLDPKSKGDSQPSGQAENDWKTLGRELNLDEIELLSADDDIPF